MKKMVVRQTYAYAALLLVAITAGVISSQPGTTTVPVLAKAAPSARDALVTASPAASRAEKALPPVLEELQRRTFRYFWDTADPQTGLVPDRYPTPSFSSIAAVGFALTAYPIGVERGWCSRADARDLTLTTLRFFWNAPQGPAGSAITGHKGFFYHFLHMQTGHRYRQVE